MLSESNSIKIGDLGLAFNVEKQGDLLLYVPVGCVKEARRLCKKHGVRVAGVRTWRFRPVWGLEVTNA